MRPRQAHLPGMPAYLDAGMGEAPVPPTWPEIRITSAWPGDAAAMVPMPERATSLDADLGDRVDLLPGRR